MTDKWLWAGFALLVVAILVFDLGVMGRRKHEIGTGRSLAMVGAYATLAMLLGGAVFYARGTDAGIEYVTAWLLEQSLSLDNIFIWVLIFEHFEIADDAQQRVLFWGIVGAIVGVPVPIIGSVIGAFVGSFAGALIAEYTRKESTAGTATRVATGALIGRVVAAGMKTGIGVVIAAWLVAAAAL